ncbi:4'-phosphopantetheinyl transferase family protein [Micromonospora sp. NPDC048898]|uniref:4'-phosphopantetheinyl transferase family protein n=1 Tax=Micromonospora sp. NPDC048898 TaxID=3364260 RepID=UPI00371E1260
MTDVWYTRVDQVPERLAALLDDHDHARRRRIPLAADRQRFLAGWVLTRLVLGRRLGWDPAALRFTRVCAHCHDPGHGKPALAGEGPSPDFSLSRTGGIALVAVSGLRVGADVEDTTAGEQPVAAALSERERAACRDYAGFARLWTRKEAVLKAAGRGLAIHPAGIEVRGTTLVALPGKLGRPADYTLHDLPLPAPYVGSLAVLGAEPAPFVRELTC